jgi:single-strand DNA-binding protein
MEGDMSFSNEFRIHGNLARDPKRGRTGNGVTTAFYVVAVEHQSRHGDSVQTSTDFIPITTYGKQAESDLKYLAKGKEVSVRGRVRSWYDSVQKRGGFCFEPEPGCVRYIGAPVSRSTEVPLEGEHDSWLQDYEAAMPQYDAVPHTTRPTRIAVRA